MLPHVNGTLVVCCRIYVHVFGFLVAPVYIIYFIHGILLCIFLHHLTIKMPHDREAFLL